jgi:hypothetical protein
VLNVPEILAVADADLDACAGEVRGDGAVIDGQPAGDRLSAQTTRKSTGAAPPPDGPSATEQRNFPQTGVTPFRDSKGGTRMVRCVVFGLMSLVVTVTDPGMAGAQNKEPGEGDEESEPIAAAGHGRLFDSKGKAIPVAAAKLGPIQDAMLAAVLKEHQPKLDPDDAQAVKEAKEHLASKTLTSEEALSVKNAILLLYLRDAPAKLQLRYTWRGRALFTSFLAYHHDFLLKLRPWLLELLRRLHLFDVIDGGSTDYVKDCQAHDVPIPPDWAETGTAWVMQGTLTQNILEPGGYAAVWTYTDPHKRGACIALPRRSGGPGSPAGIICQSATTGHACFWDNKLRDVAPEQFMGWSGLTLEIAKLKDGSNLGASCTGCHRGNNVYLISPDDATWAKVLRGPLSGPGPTPGNFTTRVESSTDNSLGYPRYVPITTIPPRPGWQNTPPAAAGCSGGCHEQPAISKPPSMAMPPACTGLSGGCYGW